MQELIKALIQKLNVDGELALDRGQAEQLVKTLQGVQALIDQQEKVIRLLLPDYPSRAK